MPYDYNVLLYDPVYNALGVPATFTTEAGAIQITVIDDTRPKTNVSGQVIMLDVEPGAFARIQELTDNGIARTDYIGSFLSFNGQDWIIRNFEPRGSPNGENLGEVRFLLRESEPVLVRSIHD